MEDDSSTLQTMNLLGARADAAQPRPWLIRRCSCAVAATLQRCPAPPTAVILTLDAMATVLALHVAVWLRFEGLVPTPYLESLEMVLPVLVATRLGFNLAAGIHRWSFRLAGLPDALRVAGAGLAGTLAFTMLCTHVLPEGLVEEVARFGNLVDAAHRNHALDRTRVESFGLQVFVVGGDQGGEVAAG